MSGWPDPDKPGVPLNPEQDGRHWLFDPENSKSYPEIWVAEMQAWAVGDAWTARMVAEMGLHYLGPVLTPERQAAIQTLEYARGYTQAWREWNACATVPDPSDREFLDRCRAQVGERSSEAVRVLRQLRAALAGEAPP